MVKVAGTQVRVSCTRHGRMNDGEQGSRGRAEESLYERACTRCARAAPRRSRATSRRADTLSRARALTTQPSRLQRACLEEGHHALRR
ncbi:hypothetical protein EXIGLDRAFT_723228 [Exidia glandulosa HHB12029]|uniref:Uncharacterized protein n=1 Tax=Exidia glandulosa HHB12029 TaxID=1314781 RepID=A0A165EWY7_EXIGL|nr:hypothetical protein EXIGLDRAFT_723228 [Exidia glandulosa HHB12029]